MLGNHEAEAVGPSEDMIREVLSPETDEPEKSIKSWRLGDPDTRQLSQASQNFGHEVCPITNQALLPKYVSQKLASCLEFQ